MIARPGTGWPGDPATPRTPIAHAVSDTARLAGSSRTLAQLDARISVCRACPRLVEWRERVAVEKRRAFADQPYWGRPVPGFGAAPTGYSPASGGTPSSAGGGTPIDARILILGLAPAAHGANRTGRMFTGDRSGDFLFGALYRAGLASRPTAVSADDGLSLRGVRITAPVHCAPPANKPTTEERDTCRPWLLRELTLLWPTLRSVVVLGGFGWTSLWPTLRAIGVPLPSTLPVFAHGAEAEVDGRTVLGCYHVSQQNTFTGRLTEPMLDAVVNRAAHLAELA